MKKFLFCVGTSALALALSPVGSLAPQFHVDAAYAKNDGGGNGGGQGNAGGKAAGSASKEVASTGGAKNAHAKLASELKGLNAVHASANALANAAPNSQVGRIAAYRDAALATIAAGSAVDGAKAALDAAVADQAQAQADLDALNSSYSGRTAEAINTDIAALDPAASDYQEKLDGLNAELAAAQDYGSQKAALETAVADATTAVMTAETVMAEAQAALDGAQATEDGALATAANGRTLSPEAIDYVRSELGL